jgi:hypothetical protein
MTAIAEGVGWPRRPLTAKTGFESPRERRNINHLGGIPHFVATKHRPKIEGQCALVCGRLAEFRPSNDRKALELLRPTKPAP